MIKLLSLFLTLILAAPYVDAYNSNYCKTCERDSQGHIKRSQEAKQEFKRQHPCPSTGATKGRCEGYIIDHIKPLACGGADSPENMQWQTVEESKAKDKWERADCGIYSSEAP